MTNIVGFFSVNELENEGRLAIEAPTTPVTVTPDTFDLGKRIALMASLCQRV